MEKLVQEYWGKTDFGKKALSFPVLSTEDWYFLIPNNVKRRNGLPTTRISKKRKSAYKKRYKQFLSFKLFNIVDSIVEEMINNNIDNFYNNFVEVKDLELGDKK